LVKEKSKKSKNKKDKIKNDKIIITVPIKDSKVSKKLLINHHEIEVNEKLLGSINPGIRNP